MLSANVSLTNVTAESQFRSLLEVLLFVSVTTVPCCFFFFLNVIMLFTLRSKPVFRESSRYVLLFNLLFGDTLQMILSQLMYLIAASRAMLTYPVCGVLFFVSKLTGEISPLTVVVMSLERYVAVCHPLQHATIITITNTGLAILVVWAFVSLNILVRVLLLLDFPFEDLDTLQMDFICSDATMMIGPVSDDYEKAYTCFVFVLATVVITSTYIGVMVAARSASTDKASAHKARNTLLLHLVQLGLSLSSTLYVPIFTAFSTHVNRVVLARLQNILFVLIFIFPRCLSSLIYGIRDQTIRPALMFYLCCRPKVLQANVTVSAL